MNIWQEGTMVEGGFDAIADEITRLNPDIVMLSEVRNYNGQSFIKRILHALQDRGTTYYGEDSSLDVGILSKYPILSQTPNGKYKEDAGSVLKAKIRIDNKEVIIYSAHLDYTNYACYLPRGYNGVTWEKMDQPITDNRLIEEANRLSMRDEAIRHLIEDVEKEKGKFILIGGDFNEPSHFDWTNETKDMWDHRGAVVNWDCSIMLTNAGFKDAYRTIYPNPITHPGFTFPSDNELVSPLKLTWAPEADERDRIDFIYYSTNPDIKIKDAVIVGPSGSIVRGERMKEDTRDTFIEPLNIWPSDHKAVLVSFLLTQ